MSILKIYACLPFLKFILFDSFLGVGENLFYLIWSSIGIFFNSFGLIFFKKKAGQPARPELSAPHAWFGAAPRAATRLFLGKSRAQAVPHAATTARAAPRTAACRQSPSRQQHVAAGVAEFGPRSFAHPQRPPQRCL